MSSARWQALFEQTRELVCSTHLSLDFATGLELSLGMLELEIGEVQRPHDTVHASVNVGEQCAMIRGESLDDGILHELSDAEIADLHEPALQDALLQG